MARRLLHNSSVDGRRLKAAHDLLDAALAVVGRRLARRALALLDRVRARLEVLDAALVNLGARVCHEGEGRLVVLCALDAVLGVSV